jgi:predicted transcriptional regulator
MTEAAAPLGGRLTIRVPTELEKAVDYIAERERTSPSDVARRCMIRGLRALEAEAQ